MAQLLQAQSAGSEIQGGDISGTVSNATVTGIGGQNLTALGAGPLQINGSGVASLVSLGPYSSLGNSTGANGVPNSQFDLFGFGSLTVNTTLTSASPCFLQTANGVVITLPVSTTCIGKVFVITSSNGSCTTTKQGADLISWKASAQSTVTCSSGNSIIVLSTSGVWYVVMPPAVFESAVSPAAGAVAYFGTATVNQLFASAAGTTGQTLISGGSGSPTWTSSPTMTHQISGGTAPTVAPQTGAGVSATATVDANAHDTDSTVTIVTGATGLASGAIAIVTFGTAFGTAPKCYLTAVNSSAGALMAAGYYVTSATGTATINFVTAPILNTTYIFNLHAGQ